MRIPDGCLRKNPAPRRISHEEQGDDADEVPKAQRNDSHGDGDSSCRECAAPVREGHSPLVPIVGWNVEGSIEKIGFSGVIYVGHKIEVVRDWQPPDCLKGVQSFLGFCNFYRRFVKDFGRIAKPLTNLTKKGEAYTWPDECQQAFDGLKQRLLSAPVLQHFQADRPTRMETDASDGVFCATVSHHSLPSSVLNLLQRITRSLFISVGWGRGGYRPTRWTIF